MNKTLDKEIYHQLVQMLEKNEYIKLLGIEILNLSKGYCKGRMKVSSKILNPYGMLHGGSLYSLADIIGGVAACTYGKFVTTVSGNMNFLLPAVQIEYIYCEAKMVRQGSHLAVYDVILMDDKGNILQNSSFTFYVTTKKVIEVN